MEMGTKTKRISLIMLTISVVVSLFAIILSAVYANDEKDLSKRASVVTTAIVGSPIVGSPIDDTSLYVLKDYNGKLAVFYSGHDTPYMEFDIETSSYSDYDKTLLLRGIHANSEDRIRQLIEDYTS